MATTSTRAITIVFTVDNTATETISAASNTAAPGVMELLTLSSGANTITVPTGGSTAKACTMMPPSGNTATLTLKGVTGDTGVLMHATDPTSISLASSVTSFVITTSAIVTGMRLYWS